MRKHPIRCALSAVLAIHGAYISHLDAAQGKIGTIYIQQIGQIALDR